MNALVALYLIAIVAANLSVAMFGPSVAVVNAFVLIAFDLVARDRLHEAWKGRGLLPRMALLIGAGSLISWLINRDAGPIALASFVAFGVSASLDALCYHLLRERAYLVKVNGSNVIGAAADSVLFPLLAFGWPPLYLVMLGQFAAKVAGGALWAWMLRGRAERQAA